MANPPNLLNDDGTASMATAFLTSHHGFRRDIRLFAGALGRVLAGNTSNFQALHRVTPTRVVCDWHPDYATTRLAHTLGLHVIAVQHHAAHFASAIADA